MQCGGYSVGAAAGWSMLWTMTRVGTQWRMRLYLIVGRKVCLAATATGSRPFAWRALRLAIGVWLILRERIELADGTPTRITERER